MQNPFLGMVEIHGFNFAPKGYALCNGQLLPISQNTALFSLLGTMYGGDGQTTFALPNLQGTSAVSFGQGPGLSNYAEGQTAGSQLVTLLANNIPQHSHNFMVYSGGISNSTGTPGPASVFGVGPPDGSGPNATSVKLYAADIGNAGVPVALAPATIGNSGGSVPVSVLQPVIVITYAIALQGVFPARN